MAKGFEYKCGKCGKPVTFPKKVLKLYTTKDNCLCIDCYNDLSELAYKLWHDRQIAWDNIFGRGKYK